MKSVWAEIDEEIAKNEKKRIRKEGFVEGHEEGFVEGHEEGLEKGLRLAINQVEETRFNRRSRRLNNGVDRVSGVSQLNSILAYTTGQATSISDVISYVDALN